MNASARAISPNESTMQWLPAPVPPLRPKDEMLKPHSHTSSTPTTSRTSIWAGLVLEQAGVHDLEGDDAVHEGVAGLEDLPHAALAERVEQHVGAEHELGGPALEDLFALVGGQPGALHQFADELGRLRDAALEGREFALL